MTSGPLAPIILDAVDIAESIGSMGTTVLASGCFDPLHVGHIEYLEAAKRTGETLLVAVYDDASVAKLKGEGRPVLSVDDRSQLVASIGVVDGVLIVTDTDLSDVLSIVRPAVVVVGGDGEAGNEGRVTVGRSRNSSSSDVIRRIKQAARGEAENS